MKVRTGARMTQSPIGKRVVHGFNDRRQAQAIGLAALVRRQIRCGDVRPQFETDVGPLNADIRRLSSCPRPWNPVIIEGVGRPLAGRGKIEFVIAGAVLRRNKGFETSVTPQTVGRSRLPWLGNEYSGQVGRQRIAQMHAAVRAKFQFGLQAPDRGAARSGVAQKFGMTVQKDSL